MENLLSLAFDNLSSYDGPKIRKGLRQVEGLLANICLSSKPRSPKAGRDDSSDDSMAPPPKSLKELADDAAFCEFFKLQEGFEWNVALRLVNTLDRLLAKGGDGQNDMLIMSALDLIQGIMLLHPPSKTLFSREMYMNILLDLLEPDFSPSVQASTLLTLVTSLIDTPQNTRTFENLDGLLTVTSLFRSRGTSRDVKLKCMEFLYFYLMPETPSPPGAASRDAAPPLPPQRSPTKLTKTYSFSSSSGSDTSSGRSRSPSVSGSIRTQGEKQALLGRHLNSVEDLVKDLHGYTPFGSVSL